MTSALVIALSLSGFILLVFGERMGLGPQLASWGVIAIFVLALATIAIASTTARLARFMVGAERASVFGFAALVAALVLLGLSIASDRGTASWLQAAGLVFGLVLAYLAAPLAGWRNFITDLAVHADRDPARGSGGGLQAIMIVTLLLAGLVAVDQFSLALSRLEEGTGLARDALRWGVLGLVGASLVFGGLSAVLRSTKFLLAIAVVAVLLPAVPLIGAEIGRMLDPVFLQHARDAIPMALEAGKAQVFREISPSLGAGIAMGLALQQPGIAVRGRARRGFGLLVGLVLAGLLAGFAQHASSGIEAIITGQIRQMPPQQWPVFVFDEPLRGWLTACGVAPEDALAAARACGQTSAKTLLPASALGFREGLAAPAYALSQGYPIILGFIWALLVPLFALIALLFLVHVAGVGFGERILFRMLNPNALRAWRLAMTRLSLIGLMILLYGVDRIGFRFDPAVLRWLMASLVLVGIVSVMAYRLLQAMRWLNARKARRPTPGPVLAAAPLPLSGS